MLRAERLLPVHWGLFNLAYHAWTEPIERLVAAAQRRGVEIAVPVPGGSVDIGAQSSTKRWWPDVPGKTADEAPAWSSGVEALQAPLRSNDGL